MLMGIVLASTLICAALSYFYNLSTGHKKIQ